MATYFVGKIPTRLVLTQAGCKQAGDAGVAHLEVKGGRFKGREMPVDRQLRLAH